MSLQKLKMSNTCGLVPTKTVIDLDDSDEEFLPVHGVSNNLSDSMFSDATSLNASFSSSCSSYRYEINQHLILKDSFRNISHRLGLFTFKSLENPNTILKIVKIHQ